MKEVKIISILTALVLLFSFCFTGCKTENEVLSSSETKSTVSEASSVSSESATVSSSDSPSTEETVSDNNSEQDKASSESISDESKSTSAESSVTNPATSQNSSSASAESATVSSVPQSSMVASSSAVQSAKPQNTASATSSAVTSSSPTVTSSSPTVTSSAVSSQVTSSAPAATSSVVASSVSSSTATTPQKPVTTTPYTVNDPQNTRGLDNTRIGCYFGVSKNDQPNQMSIDNQTRLDGYNNVEALALDTKSTDKGMYLTFDCGYEYNNLTASILDTLKAKNVKAIFFCTLSYLKRNPQLVHRMINEGHMVGNHSATHPDFTTISRTKMAEELYLFEKHLNENFGVKSKYFRFPSGNHSENTLELVTSQGYKSIFWSVAYKDWETANQPNPETAFQTITSSYHPGAVILLHAVSKTNTDILARLIDNAHQRGYRFKSLDEYYK